jgi:hypothetical protein
MGKGTGLVGGIKVHKVSRAKIVKSFKLSVVDNLFVQEKKKTG